MKYVNLLIFAYICLFCCNAYSQKWNPPFFIKNDKSDCSNCVAIDKNGDYVITGYFSGKLNHNDSIYEAKGDGDPLIAAFNKNGNCRWFRNGGSRKNETNMISENGKSIVTDSKGNIYTSGYFSKTAFFQNTKLISSGYEDIFICKHNSIGKLLWIKQVGGVSHDQPIKLLITPKDEIYLLGIFNNKVDIGGELLIHNGICSFIAQLDTHGNFSNPLKLYDNGNFKAIDFHVDFYNNIYISGEFNNKITLNGTTYWSEGTNDDLLCKLNSDQSIAWVKQLKSSSNNVIKSILVNLEGETLITGNFTGELNIDGELLNTNGRSDGYLSIFSKSGDLKRINQFNCEYEDKGIFLVGSKNKSLLVGCFSNNIILNQDTLYSSKEKEYFIAEVNSEVCFVNYELLDIDGSIEFKDAKLTPRQNQLVITGKFRNELYMEGKLYKGFGGDDLFIASYQPSWYGSENGEFSQSMLTISPNPVEDNFYIIDKVGEEDWEKVEITDTSGALVKNFSMPYSPNNLYNISELVAGTYIVSVHTKNGTKSCKIVKK